MRVLFVDDEPNILSGLRRILRGQRKEWDMVFRESGEEGLDALAEAPCEVVVSDMKMPGMDGAEFLSRVREQYPGSIRIALSGETDSHMIYRCVQHAHQYLAKPCDADTLVSTVKRISSLHQLLEDETLGAIVAEMSSIPSLPEQYNKIMQELQSEEPSLQAVGAIIETDVAMSAKILQLVNSAFFGLANTVSSPSDAAMYLGVDVLKSLVLTTGVFSQFEDDEIDKETLARIWRHSTATGSLAREIMRSQSSEALPADNAFMGGLLSDVGKLVLAANFPDKFSQILELTAREGLQAHAAERRVIGHDHMEVGAYLVGLWGLPTAVVECVAYHNSPARCAEQGFSPLSAVHMAKAIVSTGGQQPGDSLDRDYVERLGVGDKLEEWVQMYQDTDDE